MPPIKLSGARAKANVTGPHSIILIFILITSQQLWAQNFITLWDLSISGSGPNQLTFALGASGTVNYTWQEISPGTASGSGSWNNSGLTITGLPTGALVRVNMETINLLNEALFLRQLSKITNEETYANSAKRIENGIKATEKLWYNKQSKDLNYCLDSRLHPSRTDYPLLTYHDLLRLIRYHQKHTHENLSIFIRLASFKENWLIKKNLIQVRKITKPE